MRPPMHGDVNRLVKTGQPVMTETNTISRRRLLGVAVGGAALTTAAAVNATPAAAQAAHISQKVAKYQNTAKGEQRCETCALFEPPSSCRVVDGRVVSYGWCVRYTKRQT
jgi:hypothetical protein